MPIKLYVLALIALARQLQEEERASRAEQPEQKARRGDLRR